MTVDTGPPCVHAGAVQALFRHLDARGVCACGLWLWLWLLCCGYVVVALWRVAVAVAVWLWFWLCLMHMMPCRFRANHQRRPCSHDGDAEAGMLALRKPPLLHTHTHTYRLATGSYARCGVSPTPVAAHPRRPGAGEAPRHARVPADDEGVSPNTATPSDPASAPPAPAAAPRHVRNPSAPPRLPRPATAAWCRVAMGGTCGPSLSTWRRGATRFGATRRRSRPATLTRPSFTPHHVKPVEAARPVPRAPSLRMLAHGREAAALAPARRPRVLVRQQQGLVLQLVARVVAAAQPAETLRQRTNPLPVKPTAVQAKWSPQLKVWLKLPGRHQVTHPSCRTGQLLHSQQALGWNPRTMLGGTHPQDRHRAHLSRSTQPTLTRSNPQVTALALAQAQGLALALVPRCASR